MKDKKETCAFAGWKKEVLEHDLRDTDLVSCTVCATSLTYKDYKDVAASLGRRPRFWGDISSIVDEESFRRKLHVFSILKGEPNEKPENPDPR